MILNFWSSCLSFLRAGTTGNWTQESMHTREAHRQLDFISSPISLSWLGISIPLFLTRCGFLYITAISSSKWPRDHPFAGPLAILVAKRPALIRQVCDKSSRFWFLTPVALQRAMAQPERMSHWESSSQTAEVLPTFWLLTLGEAWNMYF